MLVRVGEGPILDKVLEVMESEKDSCILNPITIRPTCEGPCQYGERT